ncbi:hypothetical protein [Pyxidicoccus sp. MSG2]|uniref:hypothetical protein n=1 Tax=Pyxidicoccus sp. MSG2 TaxID=2996790 RepID=UPI0022711CA9|nr:hypothetical protein [Pyxidicoccus sp. MSG2]MCY1014490.1 hypothetical protein [Pyxidicoccus sp. MSG2]
MGRSRKIELSWRCSTCQHVNLGRHTACQNCGDPKDASEKYEMPSNTVAAATVTDPKLLRLANAGANWRCAYCGSDQRSLDGHCNRCGASPQPPAATVAQAGAPPPQQQVSMRVWRSLSALRTRWLGIPRWLWLLAAVVLLAGGVWWLTAPRVLSVRVQGVTWAHLVHVERKSLYHREGFAEARPSDAFNIRKRGERFHHTEKVLDGYDTESYTEQVECGQDCTSTPESCQEVCTDDGNGFASCSQSCSGGGQSCTTRYCPEMRTREVPRYRDEPRTSMWYAWDVWEWHWNRTAQATGESLEMRWPGPDEVRLRQGLAPGEDERERREANYMVLFADEEGRSLTYKARDPEDLARYSVGTTYSMREMRRGSSEVQPLPEGG